MADSIPLASDNGADPNFDEGEVIYRRVPEDFFEGENVLPHAFDWPAPSVLRSKYSKPLHALHLNCSYGKPLPTGMWVVAEVKISDLPTPIETGDKSLMHFLIQHRPEPQCYAHSEIRCRKDGDPENQLRERPSGKLREFFLVELAKRALIVYGPVEIA